MLRQKSVVPPEKEEELEKKAYEALEDELNNTQQRVLPLQTSLSLRTSGQGNIEASMLLLPERTTSMASLVELASIQGSGRDSSSGEQEDQVSQLKHEVFVFKAAAKQLGLLLMLRNKEIEALLQEVDFSLRDDQADGGSLDMGDWRRRAADAIQEIHETFNQESQNLGQVNMLPLVSSIPRQESSTAELTSHVSTESTAGLPADMAESTEASPSSESLLQLPDADPRTIEVAATGAVPDENPLSLQLFVVSNEAANTSPDLTLGHTSNSLKRRRSSGIRRTLLAQLQLRSVHLEQQLAASREECAAISNGLLEALSAISRRPTQDHPADAPQQTEDFSKIAHPEVPREPSQERMHALQETCARLEQQNAELEEARLQAEARCAALGRQLPDTGDQEPLGAAQAAKSAISMEADLLREKVQLLETRCNMLATERDALREALQHAQEQALPLLSHDAEQQRFTRRGASSDCLDFPAELQESIPEATPLTDEDELIEVNTTTASGINTNLYGKQTQHNSLPPATEVEITQLEHIKPELPRQIPPRITSHVSQSGQAQLAAAEDGTTASSSPRWGTTVYPYLDVESVLAMEAFYVAEQAGMCLNVPTFAHEVAPLRPAYQIDSDARPSATARPAQEEEQLRGLDVAPVPSAEGIIALQRQVVAERVRLLAELKCSRQEAWAAVQGQEAGARLLQQACKERDLLSSAVQELDEGVRQQGTIQGLQERPAACMAAEQTSKQLHIIGQVDLLVAEKLSLQQQLAESAQREAAAVDRVERSEFLQEAYAEQLRCMQGTVSILKEAVHESEVHRQETQQTVAEQHACITTLEARLVEEEGHEAQLLELVVREQAVQTSLHLRNSALEEDVGALQDKATVHRDRSAMQLAAVIKELQAERVDHSEQEAAMIDHCASQLASRNAVIDLLRQSLSEADAGRQESSAIGASQAAAVTQLSSDLKEADEYGAALLHHVVTVEAVHTALIGRLCAAEEENERLRDELLCGKDGGRRSASATGEMVTWRPHGSSLEAALASTAALRAQLAESEKCRETLQVQILDLAGSTAASSGSSAFTAPLQAEARDSGLPVHTLHQGQMLDSRPDAQSLQQELAEAQLTTPDIWPAAAASHPAELRDTIVGTADQPVQAQAGGPDADSMRRDLARALADAQEAHARCKALTAQLEDIEARRETLQAQVMDMAAAGITRERQPETPALHQTHSTASPDADDAANSPAIAQVARTALAASAHGVQSKNEEHLPLTFGVKGAPEGLVEELAAATAHITTLQAQLAESEQLRAAVEARLMHAAEPHATSSLGPVDPEEVKEPVQKVDRATHDPTIKAYYGSTFGGVVVTPAVVSTSETIEAAGSKAAMDDIELGAIGIATACALFEDDVGPAQFFEAISLSGEVEIAYDRHFGPNLLPKDGIASIEVAPIHLHDGLDEQQCCQYGDDTGAAQFFDAIDLSGKVEVMDDRHLANVPHNMPDATEMPAADVGVEHGANLQLQDELNHNAQQPADEEERKHSGKQLADLQDEVRALQTALSQSEAVFVEVESQLRRALEQEARLEQGWTEAEEKLREKLRAAQMAAANAEAAQSTLQQQLLAQHDRSTNLMAQLASAAPVQLVIKCQEPAQEVVQVVIVCQEKPQNVVQRVIRCQGQPQDGTPLDGQPLPDTGTHAAMESATVSVPETSGNLHQPAQEEMPLDRHASGVPAAVRPVTAIAAKAGGDFPPETLEEETLLTERLLPHCDGLATMQPLEAAVDEDSRQGREWLEHRPVILQITVQAGPESPQARPEPMFADAGSSTGTEGMQPGVEAGILRLAPPSGIVQSTLSMDAKVNSTAFAAGNHDGVDPAGSPVAVGAPTQHSMNTFAVLCSEVFETRGDMAEAADTGVQHVSENPLFMLSRVTDDVPMPAAGVMIVQTPPDITSRTATADVHQDPEQSPVSHMEETYETDLYGKNMSDTHEMATLNGITEGASATDDVPSAETSAKEDMQAADDDAESSHQETLRGQQARAIAQRIRESWVALQQEQHPTMADGSRQQDTQPAIVQGRVSVEHHGQGPSMKALSLREAPGRLHADDADSEDMTDVIYANWGSVAGAPENSGMQCETGHWGESQRRAELERALKAAVLRVTSLEGDVTAAAHHISVLQAQKAALTAKLARAKQQRAASAGQAGEGAELQRARLGATGEDGVSDGPDEVAQQIGSPEGTSVVLLLSGAQSAEGQCETSEDGATSASAQAASASGRVLMTSMESNEEELVGSMTRSEVADTSDTIQNLSDDFVNEEQHIAVQIDTDVQMNSLQARADSAEVAMQLTSPVDGAPRSTAASNDSALDAYICGPSSTKRVHGDDEVLAMSMAQGSPKSIIERKGIQPVAEDPSDALRCAKLAQQTEVLHTKMTAAIARIRMLESEKALAARALATGSITEVEDSRAAEDASDGCSESSSLDTSGLLTVPQELSSPRPSIPCVSKQGNGSRHSLAGAGRESGASGRAAGLALGTDGEGLRATWNPAVQASPSFNRLQQMARTISELQAEVALWKRSSQGAHLEMKKLFRTLKEKGTIISRLESQLSCSRF